MQYRVEWRLDVEAESPEEAAAAAWDTMRRPDSTACVFLVLEGAPGGPYKVPGTPVDLMPEEDAVDASGERLG